MSCQLDAATKITDTVFDQEGVHDVDFLTDAMTL